MSMYVPLSSRLPSAEQHLRDRLHDSQHLSPAVSPDEQSLNSISSVESTTGPVGLPKDSSHHAHEPVSTRFLHKSRRGFPVKKEEHSFQPHNHRLSSYLWNKLSGGTTDDATYQEENPTHNQRKNENENENENENQPESEINNAEQIPAHYNPASNHEFSELVDGDFKPVESTTLLNYSNTSSDSDSSSSPVSDTDDLDSANLIAAGSSSENYQLNNNAGADQKNKFSGNALPQTADNQRVDGTKFVPTTPLANNTLAALVEGPQHEKLSFTPSLISNEVTPSDSASSTLHSDLQPMSVATENRILSPSALYYSTAAAAAAQGKNNDDADYITVPQSQYRKLQQPPLPASTKPSSHVGYEEHSISMSTVTSLTGSSTPKNITPVSSPVQQKKSSSSDNLTPTKLDTSSPPSSPRNSAMVRKKSGELVKPSLKLIRHRSLPSSPSKMVHFDSNLVSIRRFCRGEKPAAVNSDDDGPTKERVTFHWDDDTGSDSSCSDSDTDEIQAVRAATQPWSIRTVNFSPGQGGVSPQETRLVFLDRIFLSSDKKNLIGHVYVKNVCYGKHVTVRYTLDHWKTVTEVKADFNKEPTPAASTTSRPFDPLSGSTSTKPATPTIPYDRFTFVIRLQDMPVHLLSSNSMNFCVNYIAEGDSYWDNNNNLNYEVMFQKVAPGSSSAFTSAPKTSASAVRADPAVRTARVQTRRRNLRTSSNSSQSPVRHENPVRHHRRAKTEIPLASDYEYDGDFEHDDSDLPDYFNMLTMKTPRKTPGDFGEVRNNHFSRSDDDSEDLFSSERFKSNKSVGQVKTKKKLMSRYNFGTTWNDMMSRKNSATQKNTATNSEHSESENEVGGLKRLVFPSHQHVAAKPASNSAPVSSSKSKQDSLLQATSNPGVRPAWDSLSYQDLLDKYCFFDGSASPSSHKETPNTASSDRTSKVPAELLTPASQSPAQSPPTQSPSNGEISQFLERLRV